MITIYEDLSNYDGLYASDDLAVVCEVTDLWSNMDVPGVLVEFRTPVPPRSIRKWREVLNSMGWLGWEGVRSMSKHDRRIAMLHALVEYGLTDPYHPRGIEPDSLVFPLGELPKEWKELVDGRFETWEEVEEYIADVLEG